MPGGATTLPVLRDAIEDVLNTVVGLKVYDHEPREFDALPAAAIGVPRILRAGVDEAESELGAADWTSMWPVTLAFRLDDPAVGQNEALQILGQVIGAFDADPTLGNSAGVLDAKLIQAEPSFPTDQDARQLVLYECELEVLARVS